jgi:hypothetical protein
MRFPEAKYRKQVSKLDREALIAALVREAELRHKWEREALCLKKQKEVQNRD